MKKICCKTLSMGAMLLLTVLQALAQPTNGLLGYWPFHGNANDEMNGTMPGSTGGTVLSADRFSNADEAYMFDGANDYLELTNSLTNLSFIHKTHTFAISLYFSINDLTGVNTILANANSTTLNGFLVDVDNGSLRFVSYRGVSGQKNLLTSTNSIVDNGWYHMVITGDGTSVSMYIDGSLEGTISSVANATTDSDTNVTLGGYRSSGGSLYLPSLLQGSLDDVRVYDRVLTLNEIQDLYLEANPIPDPLCNNIYCNSRMLDGLVGYWTFTNSAIDQSGFDSSSILSGGQFVDDRYGNSNNAILFDGIDDYLEIDNADHFVADQFVVSAWVKLVSTSQTNSWIFNSWTDPNQGSSKYTGFFFRDRQLAGIYLDDMDNTVLPESTQQINLGEWYHVTFVHGKTADALYLNGELQSTNYILGSFLSGLKEPFNGPFMMGCRSDLSQFTNIVMDDIMIFNRELNQSELETLPWINELLKSSTSSGQSPLFIGPENVGIGTDETFGYKLAVNGTIGAKRVKVEISSDWPDYVFEDNYDHKTLAEIEEYINREGHLPEIPGRKEVTQNGIDLGEMNAKLLQKIEELTLYLIEQNKQIDAQQTRIEQLEEDLKAMKD